MDSNNKSVSNFKILSVDVTKLPDQSIEVFTGVKPQVKCKNKFLQNLLIKIFGYKAIYETKNVKVLKVNSEDCPTEGFNGNITIENRRLNEKNLAGISTTRKKS